MAPDRRLRSSCSYCGAGLVCGTVCACCKPLLEGDPHAIAAAGPLSEAELGVLLEWPEGEADELRDEAASATMPAPKSLHERSPS